MDSNYCFLLLLSLLFHWCFQEEVIKIENKIKLVAKVIETAMKPITNAIAATASGLKDAANYLKKAADVCSYSIKYKISILI